MAIVPLAPYDPFRHPGTVSLVPAPGGRPGDPAILRTRSARTPSIVSVVQRHGQGGSHRTGYLPISYHDRPTGLTGQLGAIALIQRSSGARIGEVLRLRSSDVISPGLLLLRALKRSRPRAVRVPELSDVLSRFPAAADLHLFNVSYSQVYRAYRSAGIIEYGDRHHRNKVTHSYRKRYIQAVYNAAKSIDTTRDVVGHKSRRSTLIYLNKGT